MWDLYIITIILKRSVTDVTKANLVELDRIKGCVPQQEQAIGCFNLVAGVKIHPTLRVI